MTLGESYCYVHAQGDNSGNRRGRRTGLADGVLIGFIVGVLVSILWGPFQYTRGTMYRGGGIAGGPEAAEVAR